MAKHVHKNYPPKTRNDAKTSEINRVIRLRFKLRLYDPLVLQLGVMAKVNEKAKLKSAGFQVIENLSSMLAGQFRDGLQFDDYFVVAHKIGKIFLAQDF